MRCNIAIERIPDVEFEDESLRDRYVAEAKFLRAYQYFDLVRYFGGVPLVLGMKMPSEIEGIQRASAAEVYTQIENDLKDAANVLPVKGEYASADLGVPLKGQHKGYWQKLIFIRKNMRSRGYAGTSDGFEWACITRV